MCHKGPVGRNAHLHTRTSTSTSEQSAWPLMVVAWWLIMAVVGAWGCTARRSSPEGSESWDAGDEGGEGERGQRRRRMQPSAVGPRCVAVGHRA